MTDTPIRTPAEALEAAARIVENIRVDADSDRAIDEKWNAVDAIRALASRIAAPDEEALVEVAARALCTAYGDDPDRHVDVGVGDEIILWPAWRLHAEPARAALREAGALRHE